MKCLIFFAFFLLVQADVIEVGLTGTSGVRKVQNTVGPITNIMDPSAEKRIADFEKKYGVGLKENEEDVTNEDNFVYPCGCDKTNYDYDCIREFFANNSDCKPVCGPVPEPLVLKQYTASFPSINMTGAYSNVTFKGLNNATVCTFYYNKRTGKLVFAIKIPVIYISSSEIFFIYRQPCRENIVKSGSIKLIFKSLIFTAVIPLSPYGKLCFDLADINSYIENSRPELNFDPSLTNSTNPVVISESEKLFEILPIVINELFYFQSQTLMAVFIQTNICDFGVKLYSI